MVCNDCGEEAVVSSLNSKTLVCETCGGDRTVANPKEGVPRLGGIWKHGTSL